MTSAEFLTTYNSTEDFEYEDENTTLYTATVNKTMDSLTSGATSVSTLENQSHLLSFTTEDLSTWNTTSDTVTNIACVAPFQMPMLVVAVDVSSSDSDPSILTAPPCRRPSKQIKNNREVFMRL